MTLIQTPSVALGVGIVLGVGAVCGIALALTHRAHAMERLVVALYVAIAVQAVAAGIWDLGDRAAAAVFLGGVIVWWFGGRVLAVAPGGWHDGRFPWRAALMGAALAGCAVAVVMPHARAAGLALSSLPADVADIFAAAPDRAVWIALPFVLALLLRR